MKRCYMVSVLTVIVVVVAMIVATVMFAVGYGAFSELFVQANWTAESPEKRWGWDIFEGQERYEFFWNTNIEATDLEVVTAELSGSRVRFGPAIWPGTGEFLDCAECVSVYVRAEDKADFRRVSDQLLDVWLWWDRLVYVVELFRG